MNYEYTITKENRLSLCDEISEHIAQFCKQYLTESRDVLRYRLSAEECMAGWLTEDSIGHTISFTAEKRLFKAPAIIIGYSGEPNNPAESSDSNDSFSKSILRTLGIGPSYSYAEGRNFLQFDLKCDSDSRLLLFVGIIIAALIVGILGNLFIPDAVLAGINNVLLNPVYDLFLKLLSLVSGPLIFLSVAWGIYGIGDTASLSIIGKSVIFSYIKHTFLACTFGLIFIAGFNLSYSGSQLSLSQGLKLLDLIFGCVPSNIVEPFSSGNTLQIIFLAIAIGISLIYFGKRTARVAKAIEEINLILQYLMGLISKLVPWLIFVVVVSLLWSGTFDVLKEAWKFILYLILGTILISGGLTLIVCLKFKLSPSVFIKKCSSSFVIALLTASSAATFEKTVDICNKKLGIDSSLTGFGVPLGMVMHNPIAALNNLLVVLFFSEVYEIECNVTTLITAVICCTILAIASPPVPGGGLIVYTMIFTQFGIPLEGIAVISAIDIVSDFIITSNEMLCLLSGITLAADRVGKLNTEILRRAE